MSEDLYVVIVGCGRLGAHLANRLSSEGHSVVVIDHDEQAFHYLNGGFSGFQIEGDATQLAVLKQAKIGQADLVITATRRDNVNLMIAQVARRMFNVPRVIARVFNPDREETYRSLGVETVCPTLIAGEAFLRHMNLAGGDAP